MGTPISENRRDCPVQQPRAPGPSPVHWLSNETVDPEDPAFVGNPFLGVTQGHRIWDSLTLYARVHSAQDGMKLRSLVQSCLSYTTCHKLGSLEAKSFFKRRCYVAPSSFTSLTYMLWSTCGLHSGVTAPELEPSATTRCSSHWPPNDYSTLHPTLPGVWTLHSGLTITEWVELFGVRHSRGCFENN